MELSTDTIAQFKDMTKANGADNTDSDVYVAKPTEGAYFDDGREVALLHFIYDHPSIDDIRGSPAKVLQAIDEYGRTKAYMMNVGNKKSKIVTDLIAELKPQTMVELGSYIGYSAIVFGDAAKKAGGKRYFSFERNPEFAAVTMALVDLAGLSDFVKIVVGPSAESIKRTHAEGGLEHIDLMFLDHHKPAYTSDLKLCEHLKLVTTGSVMAADNVVDPGNPPYLAYVRSSVAEKRDKAEKGSEGNDTDGFDWGSRKNAYKKRVGKENIDTEIKGNPNLKYESKLVMSYEPTGQPVSGSGCRHQLFCADFVAKDGLEITRCVGEESV
ncbi:MAG: hypothetical protein M1812_007363 [Candelaria pacifica]|nr:MAG: hypothetical protein M1812_007363 [Candelaria pacifica]